MRTPWLQVRGGWKKEEKRLKQELAVREKLARKAGRLAAGGAAAAGVAHGALAEPGGAPVATKKRKADGPAAAAGAGGGGGGGGMTDGAKRLRAMLPSEQGATKKAGKLGDDVAKVLDKALAKIEKAEAAAVRPLAVLFFFSVAVDLC